jgi:hypothetical protein
MLLYVTLVVICVRETPSLLQRLYAMVLYVYSVGDERGSYLRARFESEGPASGGGPKSP